MDGKSMFGDIKSKLGFGRKNGYEEFYEDYEEFEEGDDYGEYGYDESYERTSGSAYDPYDSVTTREPGERSRGRSSMPRLVSIDDVRAHTQLPDSLTRDPLPPRRVSSASALGYRGERTMVDSSLPPSLTPEGTAAAAAAASAPRRDRSEGLNSLFEPSGSDAGASRFDASDARSPRGASAASPAPSPSQGATAPTASASSSRSGFDPYEAYAGTGATSFSSSRSCTVFKPASYGEVERIAKILKAGDVVVLALRNTPDSLAKRILDFSFGVSSALEANVECVADKVFAITRGGALTDAERVGLRVQGVL